MLIFISVLALATVGFTQTSVPPQISAADSTNYLNQQVVVVDKVVQVVQRPTIWLLHLNQRYPKSPLNCVVRGRYTNDFPNFEDYLGQHIEVTGRITDFRGRLELVLTSTNQIKIIGATQSNPTPTPRVAEAQIKTPAPASPPTTSASTPQPVINAEDSSGRALGWILGLLAVISLLLAAGIFLFWRRNADHAQASRPAGRLLLDDATPDSPTVQGWKQRALAAEAMAGKQGQMLREQLIPELTEFAKQSLVQGLYAQRNVLLETQLKAQQALAELESRLKTLQAPLHERIRVYENRIAELEREVETQGEEVRELTRATLALVRKKLEDERESERLQSRYN